MPFILESPAFIEAGSIPSEYTCDGENITPPLKWQGEPTNTKSYALIMDDPDAPVGVWDHWLLYNIPKTVHELPTNVIPEDFGAEVGKNSWGKTNYGGPCPPDREHRYLFKLYALDMILNLSSPTKSQLQNAMQGHILSTTTLMGKYNRSR